MCTARALKPLLRATSIRAAQIESVAKSKSYGEIVTISETAVRKKVNLVCSASSAERKMRTLNWKKRDEGEMENWKLIKIKDWRRKMCSHFPLRCNTMPSEARTEHETFKVSMFSFPPIDSF